MALDSVREQERRKKIKKNNAKFWFGKKRSEETKEKIRKSLLGKKLSRERIEKLKGRIPWNKGKSGYHIHLEEWKKRLSEMMNGNTYSIGRKWNTEEKQKRGEMMTKLWKEGKIKLKEPWNRGKSTKELGKSRPKVAIMKYICENCGKEFQDWKILKRKFCSKKCQYEFWKKTGKFAGENNSSKRPEVAKKISEAKKGIPLLKFRGSGHPNWKGGLSFEPYTIDWTETLKKAIRERDHYLCRKCNQYGNVIHHIDYDKKNCNPNNLINLCRSCNSKINKNRNFWTSYFQQRLK